MNIDNIEKEYLQLFHLLNRQGVKNKLLVLLMMIPAFFLGYIFINPMLVMAVEEGELKAGHIFLFIAAVAVFWIAILLLTKSLTFVGSGKLYYFRKEFKKQLYACIKEEIPEIKECSANKKMHPRDFYASGLFIYKFDDYLGDDCMKGSTADLHFDICELHVRRLVESIFNGIFVKCQIDRPAAVINLADLQRSVVVSEFQEKYKAQIKLSMSGNHLYMAVDMKGYFFENTSKGNLEKLDSDLVMLKDLVNIIKRVTHEDNLVKSLPSQGS